MFTGEWLEWGRWSECSEKCGGGEKIRSRKCHYDTRYGVEGQGAPCKGAQSDTIECNKDPCAPISPGIFYIYPDVTDMNKLIFLFFVIHKLKNLITLVTLII